MGVILCCNSEPIILYSKRHNTVKISNFGVEFAAMWIAMDLIVSLRYNLRMIGLPIEGAANVFRDN